MTIERIALILFATLSLGLAVAQTGRSQGFPQGGLPVPAPPMGSPKPGALSRPTPSPAT